MYTWRRVYQDPGIVLKTRAVSRVFLFGTPFAPLKSRVFGGRVLKSLLSLVLSLSLISQSAAAAVVPGEFFCRRLLENENANVVAELFYVERLGRSPVEVLKVHVPGKKEVPLKQIINPKTEILFGWKMSGRRPILVLYFQNLEVRIALYPHPTSTDPTTAIFTIEDSAYVEKGVYFAAQFSPQKIDQAANFVRITSSVEQKWHELNHVYTNTQRMADLNKLLSLFFIEPIDGEKRVKFNKAVITHPVVVGNLSQSALKERLKSIERWQPVTDDELHRTSHAARVFMVVGAVGMAFLVTYGLINGLSP
jgi:hypothetical protein